jgi:hypothetical protein
MDSKRFSKSLMILLGLAVVSIVGGCAAYVMNPMTQPGKAPVIAHTYSVERGRYGDVLKIYIQADDPDNDMLRIATVVEQAGVGRYPTDWIFIKPQYQGHFSGYLKWNTYSPNASHLSEWTWITIKVSIFDKTGRESNVVVFPFEFVSEVIKNPSPPAPFDQKDIPMLGNITVNLYEPGRSGGGYWWWD